MSTVLSYEDKKIIDDALTLTRELNHWVSTTKTDFKKKGTIALWWDAKGFWNSSYANAVLRNMDTYKEVYENVVTSMELIEKGGEESYEQLLELYGKLEELEKCAKGNVKNRSKALCQVARDFLDHHYKLDHKLKRVESVVLTKNIRMVKERVENLTEMLSTSIRNLHSLTGDNSNLKDSLDALHEENQELKDTMATVIRENQELRNTIAESNARAEERFEEFVEENRRNMERMMTEVTRNTQL